MSRPCKKRRICGRINSNFFKPAGIQLRELKEIVLSPEECEAIRLKDLQGLDQKEGAVKMNISQPTFHRSVLSARKKIADALINGKAIRIKRGKDD